jgi:hypothetical protein
MPFSRFAKGIDVSLSRRQLRFVFVQVLMLAWVLIPAQAQTCQQVTPGIAGWWRAKANALDTINGNHGSLQSVTGFAYIRVSKSFVTRGTNGSSE